MTPTRFINWLRGAGSLRRDRRGNVAMMAALGFLGLATATGGAIDVSRVVTAREQLQQITDSAALAGKGVQQENRALGATTAKTLAEAAAHRYFARNQDALPRDMSAPSLVIIWDPDDESLRLEATATTGLMFGNLIGLPTVPLRTEAIAAAGLGRKTELALVLDNTASMFSKDGRPETRFTLLRRASERFVNTLFDRSTTDEQLTISVIPWTTTVNVLSERPDDWDPAAGAAIGSLPDFGSRSAVAAQSMEGFLNQSPAARNAMFAPTQWRGCISGTGETSATDDSPKPGMRWDVLAVPSELLPAEYRPDEPYTTTCTSCTGDCGGGGGPPGPQPEPPPPTDANYSPWSSPARAGWAGARDTRPISGIPCTCVTASCVQRQCQPGPPTATAPVACWQSPTDSESRLRNIWMAPGSCMHGGCYLPGPSVETHAGCVSDYNEVGYNAGGGAWCANVPRHGDDWNEHRMVVGPNINCPAPMLGQSGSRAQILAALGRMTPAPGGTHADVGLRWGLRSLSPRNEWVNVFGHNSAHVRPRAFSANNVQKVMVLITDGENTQAYDSPGYWGCAQAGAPGCTGAPNQATLDARMIAWCDSIREDHDVALFTIAVNVAGSQTDPNTPQGKLFRCAGSDPRRALAIDAADLQSALDEIALSMTALRLKE
jgi:Flp pilus assembly protein TadG